MARILIVEDDIIIHKMYQTLLENHGHTVTIATDGEEGLRKALKEHPDLIMLDVLMPKMDGMTVMHHLREDEWGKKAAIIILTNLDANDERLTGVVQDQPSYYLIKSNNQPEQILEKVDSVLNSTEVKE